MSQAFTTHVYNMPMAKSGGIFKLIPIGDIHRDSHNCDVDGWKKFLKRAKEEDDGNTMYIGLGDYNDFASYSERHKMKSARLHESTCIKMDKWAQKDVDALADEMEFMGSKMIGLIEGNHGWEFLDGDTDTDKLSNRLLCPNLGALSYVRINFQHKGETRAHINLFLSHGKGGGQLIGTSFNKVDKMREVCDDADIYIMGHDHKKGIIPVDVIGFRSKRDGGIEMENKQKLLVRSGSFLKGYVENEESYVARALLRPASLGVVKVEIEIRRSQRNGGDVYEKSLHGWS